MFITIGMKSESVLASAVVSIAVEKTPKDDVNQKAYPYRVVVRLSDGRSIPHTWCDSESSAYKALDEFKKYLAAALKK